MKEDPKRMIWIKPSRRHAGYQLANGVFVYGMYSYVKDANSPYFGEGIMQFLAA
ncbi:MAG: hypothetical protein R3C41_03965 [Calditrichia bacterium]